MSGLVVNETIAGRELRPRTCWVVSVPKRQTVLGYVVESPRRQSEAVGRPAATPRYLAIKQFVRLVGIRLSLWDPMV